MTKIKIRNKTLNLKNVLEYKKELENRFKNIGLFITEEECIRMIKDKEYEFIVVDNCLELEKLYYKNIYNKMKKVLEIK